MRGRFTNLPERLRASAAILATGDPLEWMESLTIQSQLEDAAIKIEALDRESARTPDPAQIRADALLTDAARDVLAERSRQVSAEGWTPEHDDAHGAGQMALAAGCYAMFASVSDSERASTDLPGSLASLGKPIRGWAAWLQIWPWDRLWWKPTDRRRDLVKAAALILAEIERLDRAIPLSPTAVDGSPSPDAGGKDGV